MIRWTPEATADFEGIRNYIQADNPAAAARQCEEILSSIQQLKPFTNLGKSTRVYTIRQLVIPRAPYIVFYRPEANAIVLIRILHGMMLIPKHLRK